MRAGLVRAVDDAEDAGALSPLLATPLREIAERIPVDEGIALIEDSERVFGDAEGLLDDASSLLEQAGCRSARGRGRPLALSDGFGCHRYQAVVWRRPRWRGTIKATVPGCASAR